MLPTCIGISGVSRYRNDASMADSFLASLIGSSREQLRNALNGASLFLRSDGPLALGQCSGLCPFWRRICNGKGPRPVKLAESTFLLGQAVGDRPQYRRVDAKPYMAREIDLDI